MKERNFIASLYLQGADFWSPGKRMLMDPTFLEKFGQVDVFEVDWTKLSFHANLL